ncbi:uncharacterized protein V6R79_017184 [Siganus canaliculatus]
MTPTREHDLQKQSTKHLNVSLKNRMGTESHGGDDGLREDGWDGRTTTGTTTGTRTGVLLRDAERSGFRAGGGAERAGAGGAPSGGEAAGGAAAGRVSVPVQSRCGGFKVCCCR